MIRTILIVASWLATSGISYADLVETDPTPNGEWDGFSSVSTSANTGLATSSFVTLEIGARNSNSPNIVPELQADGLVATSNDPFATSSDSNLNRVFIGAESGNADYRLMIDLFGIYDTSTINVNSWHLGGHIDPNF